MLKKCMLIMRSWSGSLGCQMLTLGFIVILLAGVFGVTTGPALREETRTQLYHRWALEFEETWDCIDVVGVAENHEGNLEIYLRGRDGSTLIASGEAFYKTEVYRLENIAERLGYPVDFIIVIYAPTYYPMNVGKEFIVTDMALEQSKGFGGDIEVPAYLQLWEGRGE